MVSIIVATGSCDQSIHMLLSYMLEEKNIIMGSKKETSVFLRIPRQNSMFLFIGTTEELLFSFYENFGNMSDKVVAKWGLNPLSWLV